MVTIAVDSARVTLAADSAGSHAVNANAAVQEAPNLQSAKAFLLSRPLGVYTCARAVSTRDGMHLVLWPFHLARLAQGLSVSIAATHVAEPMVKTIQETTSWLVQRALRVARGNSSHDVMITVLWSASDASASPEKEIQIDVHVCPMPQVKALSANVLVNGSARDNADCKHSRWITERVHLENHQARVASTLALDLHESILSTSAVDGDRVLLEGLITNFFVVENGCIYTCGSGILPGSTRAMVLLACKALGIPVVLEAPRLSEIATWQAAFLTSAVRIVIPIAQVLWHPQNDTNRAVQSFKLDVQATEAQFLRPLREQIQMMWHDQKS